MDVKSQASLEVGVEVRAGYEDAKKGWWATRNAYVEPHDIDTKRIAIRRIREERALLMQYRTVNREV
jgi:hypothetical protein